MELLANSGQNQHRVAKELDLEAAENAKLKQAESKIRLREISRARVQLTSAGMALGNDETLRELTDPELRPNEVTMEIPEHFYSFQATEIFKMDPDGLLSALRSAGRGSAQDLAGARYEHYRVLIEDEDLWGVLLYFASLSVERTSHQKSCKHCGSEE